MFREETPEHRAGSDTPSVVAAEGDDIRSEAMEAWQRVRGHAHHSIPLRLELDLAYLGKCLLERALRPGAVDLETSEAQRADAAEEKASGLIETERVHDETSVPAALGVWQDRGPQIRRERPGREIEIGHADLLPLSLRPRRAFGVGVSGDHDPVRGHTSAIGLEPPARARPLSRTHRALRVDRGARCERRARQPPRIGERLDGAGAQVEQRARIDVDANPPRRFLAAENLHRRAARAPLGVPLLDLGETRLAGRALPGPGGDEFARDALFMDEPLNLGRPFAKQLEQPLAIAAEPRRDVVGRKPHAGVDQADVAPCPAEADFNRLERDDLRSSLGQPERRREPGIAATDDRCIGPNLALERRGLGRRESGYFPEAV